MNMARTDVDWSNLGFAYRTISKRYVANFKDGKWGEGVLTEDANIVLNECAGILQYCQEVFEGLKAYTTKDGRIVVGQFGNANINAAVVNEAQMLLE